MERNNKAGVTILILERIDFKTKTIIRDKEEHNDRDQSKKRM